MYIYIYNTYFILYCSCINKTIRVFCFLFGVFAVFLFFFFVFNIRFGSVCVCFRSVSFCFPRSVFCIYILQFGIVRSPLASRFCHLLPAARGWPVAFSKFRRTVPQIIIIVAVNVRDTAEKAYINMLSVGLPHFSYSVLEN